MKNLFKLTLVAIALAIFFNTFTVTEAKAQNPLPEILKRMDGHYKLLKLLKADIKRVQRNSQLGEDDTTSGTITLLPGEKEKFSLRLDWTKPRQEILIVVNGKYLAYIPAIKRAYKGLSKSKTVSDKGGNILKVMSMSKAELQKTYNIQYLGQENVNGNTPTWHIKLNPKAKSNFKFADLWVDADGMPILGRVTMLNNDYDSALLTNLDKNGQVPGSFFELNLPKETQIIEN